VASPAVVIPAFAPARPKHRVNELAGLTLATDNKREFQRIQGLKIQNWVD
jgi:hypothetical protein